MKVFSRLLLIDFFTHGSTLLPVQVWLMAHSKSWWQYFVWYSTEERYILTWYHLLITFIQTINDFSLFSQYWKKKLSGSVERAWVSMVSYFKRMPTKQHSQSSPILVEMGWIGCAIYQATSKWLPGFWFRFNIFIFIYLFESQGVRQHCCKKKAATVGQNGRLSALCNFFSFWLIKLWGTTY